jgi:uncharacterized protein
MPSYEKQSTMPVRRQALFSYHDRPGALERLIPPWQDIRIIRNDASPRDGCRVELEMKQGPLRRRWVAEHYDYEAGHQFRDRALRGPFKTWLHTHLTRDGTSPDTSVLVDQIEYELPLGILGRLGAGWVRGQLETMFAFRHARTRFDVARHAAFAECPRLRVAVSGASGAVASQLIPFLTTAGHSVSRFVRGQSKREQDIAWTPATGAVEEDTLAQCDAIVHLAGSSIAVRWTKKNRREIEDSRVLATRKLCERVASMSVRPRVMVCASAVGYYGDRGEEALTEASPAGDNWSAKLCQRWEEATAPARDAGIRVVNVRIGVVLSARTGAIPKLLTPLKLGVAGRVGGGQQWMPWIAMDDLVGVIHEALMRDDWQGPINAVTASVRQHDFIRTLGRVMHRPTFAPLPALAVKTLFGQMGTELLLGGQNIVGRKLNDAGFEPVLPELEGALRFELGR